jgi:hypothetical protein
MRARPPVAAALACCLLLASGCVANVTVGTPNGRPDCPAPGGRVANSLVLAAQSVPTAQWLPCLRPLPLGWSFRRLEVQSGRTQVTLGASDENGDHRVLLLLRQTCDVAGASEVDSRQAGVRRYDRVAADGSGYHADRYYVFSGGCVAQRFDLQGRAGAQAVGSVSGALGFVSRGAVAAAVDERSRGRITLDRASG